MKKITLILSVMFIWGCSQAQDQEVVDEAKAMAKEVITDQVETVKADAVEKASNKAASMTKDVATDKVDAIKTDTVEKVSDKISTASNENVSSMIEKVTANSAAYQAGIHYKVINPPYNTDSDEEVVVYEFFSYMCSRPNV